MWVFLESDHLLVWLLPYYVKKITKEVVELAGKFKWKYKSKGNSLSTIDTLIKATSVREKLFYLLL